jgi:hypothetical protein
MRSSELQMHGGIYQPLCLIWKCSLLHVTLEHGLGVPVAVECPGERQLCLHSAKERERCSLG